MTGSRLIATLAAGLSLCGLGARAAPADGFAAAFAPVHAQVQARDCRAAGPALRRLSQREDFPAADAAQALLFWKAVIDCAEQEQDWADGYSAARKATASTEAGADLWRERAVLALRAGAWDDGVSSLQTTASLDPAQVRAIDGKTVSDIWEKIRTQGDATPAIRFLAALWSADWAPETPGETADQYWRVHAALLRANGRPQDALKVAAAIQDPDAVYGFRIDPLWAGLVRAHPDLFDEAAVARRRLATLAQVQAAHPELLSVVANRAQLQSRLGDGAGALQLLDAASARLEAASGSGGFADADKNRNWYWNTRGWVLLSLGRFTDAEAAMRRAASLPESGRPNGDTRNVSQVINLAVAQGELGEPAAVLETLKVLDDGRHLSDFGHANVDLAKACAFAQTSRGPDLDAALTRLGASNAYHRIRALTCADRLDEAAAMYVQELTSLDSAGTALELLSGEKQPQHPAPFAAELDRRRVMIAARPEVRRAIAKIGAHLDAKRLTAY